MRVGSIHTPRDSRRPGATPRQAARPVLAEGRVRLVGLGLLTLFLLLLGRALYLQVVSQDFLQDQGSARYSRVLRLEATRGMITDRNNEPLAISSPVESIWASPADMDPVPAAQVARLARLLDMPADLIGRRLADKRREFVYLKRQVSPELAREVMALGIPGISTQPEFRRFYPAGEITSHLVGYTGIDGQGMEGMELTRESMLAGAAGRRHVIKDRRGHVVEDIAAIERPRDGQTLTLSIDRRIQYLAWRELKVAMEKSNAKAASMVVIDARTGEVLALVNLPTFNPNNRSTMAPELRRNHAVIDIYEPGSTLKPFAIAKALDAGLVRPNQVFETLPYMIGPARIRDTHDYPALDVAGVLQKSSNVGSSKIALLLPPHDLWQFYSDLGFGRRPQSGFPGEAAGMLRPWKHWRPIEQATMSYGHGISVSLLQLVRAYTIFTNDGVLLPLSFTRLAQPLPGRQVLRPETARKVRDMLVSVTQPGGTATRAQVLGYTVGGKTGTSRKLENGRYVTSKYVASFAGFVPASRPRLIAAVMLDEPDTSGGQYYGGISAAPVFSRVMAGSLRVLGIEPDAPTHNTLLPADMPVVKEET